MAGAVIHFPQIRRLIGENCSRIPPLWQMVRLLALAEKHGQVKLDAFERFVVRWCGRTAMRGDKATTYNQVTATRLAWGLICKHAIEVPVHFEIEGRTAQVLPFKAVAQ